MKILHQSVLYIYTLKQLFNISNKGTCRNRTWDFNRNIYRFKSGTMASAQKDYAESFRRLPPPVKGLTDEYEYSVIQLKNGLTALLISDVENLITLDTTETALNPATSSESEDESVSGSEDEMEEDPSMGKGKESDEKLAALALTIGTGSFCDGDIPGLAHFLEHMVFMGSGKYPEENDFDAFLSSRGGSCNASTEYETTTFHFEVPEPHLKQSMDIFSNFFIEPLLRKDSIHNEMEIVDSEFQSSILNDTVRCEQLMATMCSPDNPARKFVWGNLDTLRYGVDESVLYSKLQELRRNHYVGNYMTLALQARLDLATLEAWVVEHFSAIPSNESPRPQFKSDPPFLMDKWHKFYTIKPVDNTNELHLTWYTPSTQHLYRSKPLDFLSWFLGHEGPGSIISYLRDEKLLATSIEAGFEGSGFDFNHMYTLFTIDITLSDKGVREVKHILDVVFQYLSLLTSSTLTAEMYEEVAKLQQMGFDYKSNRPADDYVAEASQNMQYYPSEEYLTGGVLFKEYNPEEIAQFLNLLTPERLNISLLSKLATSSASILLDQTEPWFKTEYKVEAIDSAWIKHWRNAQVANYLHLPGRNKFVTTDFSLLPVNEEVKYPTKIMQNDSVEVWFKQTVKYKMPRSVVYFILETPYTNESIMNSVLCDLFHSAVNMTISSALYNPSLARYYVTIARGEYGIQISIDGFSQHIEQYLGLILELVTNATITQELFLMCRETILRRYINNLKDSEVLRRALRMGILVQDTYLIEDKYRLLRDQVSLADVLNFQDTLFKRMYVKCLAMGNITEATTLTLVSTLCSHLPFTPLDQSEREKLEVRVSCLEPEEKILRVQSLNEKDPNLMVLNYYQSGENKGSLREACVIEILVEIISEPLFDTLRTKQKLGYYVNATVRDTFGILGVSVLVESQMKHKVDDVENKIQEFITRYVKDNVDNIGDKYEDIIGTLVKRKKMVELNLKDESTRHLDEIKLHVYMFDRQERELQYVQNIQLQEIVDWIERNIVQVNKKLSVQIVGTLDEKIVSTSSNKTGKRKHSDSNIVNAKQKNEDNRSMEAENKICDTPTSTNPTTENGNFLNGVENIESMAASSVSNNNRPDDLVLHYLPLDGDKRFIKDIKEYRKTLQLYPVMKLK